MVSKLMTQLFLCTLLVLGMLSIQGCQSAECKKCYADCDALKTVTDAAAAATDAAADSTEQKNLLGSLAGAVAMTPESCKKLCDASDKC